MSAEVQCETCGAKIEKANLKIHLCQVSNAFKPKGPMDEGFDICAEVREFLRDRYGRKTGDKQEDKQEQ